VVACNGISASKLKRSRSPQFRSQCIRSTRESSQNAGCYCNCAKNSLLASESSAAKSCLYIRAEKDRLHHRNQDINRAMLAVQGKDGGGTL
jgi:hypothetical protein